MGSPAEEDVIELARVVDRVGLQGATPVRLNRALSALDEERKNTQGLSVEHAARELLGLLVADGGDEPVLIVPQEFVDEGRVNEFAQAFEALEAALSRKDAS